MEVTHANLRHLIEWHKRAFSVSASDRASHVAGLAFDAAVWEIWCHLAAGASLHLIDEGTRLAPELLKDWLVAQRITIAFVPTVLVEYLITFDWPSSTSLRTLLTGADTLHRYPNPGLPFVLFNNYGPTECTVLVTSGAVRSGLGDGSLPSLGRPIEDTQILVLDAQMKPVAQGDEGEICVAGPQVARGYRNLPHLTAKTFVLDSTGGRLYRTGDRGRLLPSGEIAFLGRMDDQIKVRGFRVEPDEVVAHLNSHPAIRNSVVVALNDKAGEKMLVAYLVLAVDAELTTVQVRSYLAARTPDYMVPAVYVHLSSLPMTTTGKCDKPALPAPSAANRLPDSNEANPIGEFDTKRAPSLTEARVAQLVSGLMDGRPISHEDNFFLIGGHSLMAAQLIARLRDHLAVSLTLRQLFESPTIASLAALVDAKNATK